jgi:hypothetical protein
VSDLTVIYLTCNQMPSRWERFHREHLLRAVEGHSLITISAKPVDLPGLHLIQTGPFCAWNVYKQLLFGSQLAETKYVAVAEDDTLYPRKHFTEFRPKEDELGYDLSRWSVFSWVPQPFFSNIRKRGNFTMIGPRKLIIEALEEREALYPEGLPYSGEIGRPDIERRMRVTKRKAVDWDCIEPMINLCHPRGLSPTYENTPKLERKPGALKAIEVPIWGRADRIAAIYNEGIEEECRSQEHTSSSADL